MKNSTGWFYGLVGLLAAVSALVFTGCPTESEEKTYTAKPPAVTGVTVTQGAVTTVDGAVVLAFTAAVAGENDPPQTVTWSIVETGIQAGTAIDANGNLTLALNEASTSLTVKAVSTADTSKNGAATIGIDAIAQVRKTQFDAWADSPERKIVNDMPGVIHTETYVDEMDTPEEATEFRNTVKQRHPLEEFIDNTVEEVKEIERTSYSDDPTQAWMI